MLLFPKTDRHRINSKHPLPAVYPTLASLGLPSGAAGLDTDPWSWGAEAAHRCVLLMLRYLRRQLDKGASPGIPAALSELSRLAGLAAGGPDTRPATLARPASAVCTASSVRWRSARLTRSSAPPSCARASVRRSNPAARQGERSPEAGMRGT